MHCITNICILSYNLTILYNTKIPSIVEIEGIFYLGLDIALKLGYINQTIK